jgi:hypothetical protein
VTCSEAAAGRAALSRLAKLPFVIGRIDSLTVTES